MRSGPLIGLILAGLVIAALGVARGGDAPIANRGSPATTVTGLADGRASALADGRTASPAGSAAPIALPVGFERRWPCCCAPSATLPAWRGRR